MAATFVQAAKSDTVAGSSAVQATLASGTTAGSFTVIAGSLDSGAPAVGSLQFANDKGDTATVVDAYFSNPTTGQKSFCYAFFNCTAGAKVHQVTALAGTITTGDLFVWEFSGLTSPVADKVTHAVGASSSPDSGSTGVLASADEAAIAYCYSEFALMTAAGSGWSTVAGDGITTTTGNLGEHRTVAATTAINGTGSQIGTGNWTALVATFKSSTTLLSAGWFPTLQDCFVARKRKIVSDNITAPLRPYVATPSAFGYQTVDGGVKRKIRYVPEPFAFAPVAYVPTPSVFGYQAVDGGVKRKIRYIPEPFAFAPVPYTAVPTPSDFGYQTVDGGVKRKIRYLPEAFALAPAAYTAVPTPSDLGYQTVDGGIKRKIRYLPEALAVVPVPVTYTPTPSDFGYQTEGGRSRRVVRSIPEAMAAFVRGDVPIVPVAAQKDGDPDYWKLPWFNVEGGSFTESLRTRAITALEEAATLAEQAEPAKAKRAARKAAKGLQEYAKTGGALLSDDVVIALGHTAKQLNYAASQWDRSELIERVSNARMALLAYEAALQDEEDALIALMVN